VRPGHLLPTLVALASLAFPAGAMADDFQQIFGDYKSDGQINGCYRPDQIHNAGRDIPPDIEQYAPGFGDALSSAGTRCGSGAVPESEPDEEPALVSAGTGPGGPDIEREKAVREPPAPRVAPPPVPTELVAPQLSPAAASVSSDTPGALIALLVAAASRWRSRSRGPSRGSWDGARSASRNRSLRRFSRCGTVFRPVAETTRSYP
jgi:hypothetical protein